ncbi:MAG: ABC transporter ATP-binding protein [Halodesulfurarchaeum sp.]
MASEWQSSTGGSNRATATRDRNRNGSPRESSGREDGPEPILRVDGVSKRFGSEQAVRDLSFEVRDGELLTLLGPSGCGKTTTLRLLAGLEVPTTGTISIDGTEVADASRARPPEERSVGMVFQDFALFPHLSVRENIAFGLEDEAGAQDRVSALLALVDMEGMGDRSPDQLSGGQQQRVALARALAPEPEILLLDEPFSSLDVRLRVEMREEVRRILKEAGVTAVSVTHDQEEALSLSDRVAVMREGTIEQLGPPGEVFQNPASRGVADFLGQAGFLSAEVASGAQTSFAHIPADQLPGIDEEPAGETVDVLVRPDDVRVRPSADDTPDGRIVRRQYTGPTFIYHVALDTGDEVRCLHTHHDEFEVGDPVDVELVADHELAWFPRREGTE